MAAVVLAVPACSSPEPAAEPEPSAPPATLATTDGTEPGTELGFGDSAVLAWQPTQDLAGELELTVEAVAEQRQSVFDGWTRDDAMVASRPYFVTVTLANVGDTDLGGLDVPLYLLDTSDTLGPPWSFEEPFAPCRSRPLPAAFAPGDSTRTCLVYFARAGSTYDAMAFQPVPDVEAITWTGEPERVDRERPSRRRR